MVHGCDYKKMLDTCIRTFMYTGSLCVSYTCACVSRMVKVYLYKEFVFNCEGVWE